MRHTPHTKKEKSNNNIDKKNYLSEAQQHNVIRSKYFF